MVYGGALWVVCSPELPDAELTLYTGRGSAWGQVEADELGKPKKETVARATKLVLAGGNLFLTVAYLDAETGVPDGGELLACDLGESKLEFERLGKRLKDGDVPLSLAVHESTVYVGTLSGRLLYLVPDPKQKKPDDFKPTFEEELVPSSLGIHSLLPRNNGALMLGQFGPAATDVVLRVREP